jgi:cytochrome P450 family 6
MFETITNCGHVLDKFLATSFEKGVDVFEFRDLMARWTTNIISSVAFGIETDCINERDHIFRRMALKQLENNWRLNVQMFLSVFMPKATKLLKFKLIKPDVTDFMVSIVKQTVEYREKNNVDRNDFMQLLIQLKNQGFVSVDRSEVAEKEVKKEVKRLSLMEMAAQVFLFFTAGKLTVTSNCILRNLLAFQVMKLQVPLCLTVFMNLQKIKKFNRKFRLKSTKS